MSLFKNHSGQRISTGKARLLVDCLVPDKSRKILERLRRLSPSDWEIIIRQSEEHAVGPLLFRRLKSLTPEFTIPDGVMQRFQKAYYISLKRNIRIQHELKDMLEKFNNEAIPVVLLKGAHLAEFVYKNPALRPMVDTDLLVRQDDLERVEARLQEMGYKPSTNIGRIDRKVECGMSKELPMYTKSNWLFVDVHWDLEEPVRPFTIDVEGLWKRARNVNFGGAQAMVLSPEDLMLHLCLHTAYHNRLKLGLLPLCDILETLNRFHGELDWAQLLSRAREWGAGKWVFISLFLVKDLFLANVPDGILQALKPEDFHARLKMLAREKIFSRQMEGPGLSPNMSILWGRKPIWEKARLYFRNIFPARKVMSEIYGVPSDSFRINLLYVVRLKDLIVRYGFRNALRHYASSSWRMIRHKEEREILVEGENALAEWLKSASGG